MGCGNGVVSTFQIYYQTSNETHPHPIEIWQTSNRYDREPLTSILQGILIGTGTSRTDHGISRMHLFVCIPNLAHSNLGSMPLAMHSNTRRQHGLSNTQPQGCGIEVFLDRIQNHRTKHAQPMQAQQVVFVLDICNVAGTNLESYLWNKPNLAESPYLWPKIPKPTPMEWRLWQPALQHATSTGWNLALPLQLGKWYPKKDSSPGWYHHAQENTLYHQRETGYT